jgi:hypothetical protein
VAGAGGSAGPQRTVGAGILPAGAAEREDILRLARAAAREAGGERSGSGCSASEPDPRAGFIDLGTVGSGPPRCEIRLDLGGGVVLQVVRG